MKIMTIADKEAPVLWEYLDRSLLDGVDLVLSCGDLAPQYLSFLATFVKCPVLYVHGNHDDCYANTPPEGCICVEDTIYVHQGVRILGLGGSMRYKPGIHQYTQMEMNHRIRKLWLPLKRNGGVVKEWMYWYTRMAAKKIHSDALMADAWHHRSDALSSVGALVGIAGARMGYPVMDSVASVVICVFILKVAVDVFHGAVDKLVDKSCSPESEARMRDVIEAQQGVLGIDSLKTRIFGAKYYVDVEIAADGGLTLREGHEIAETVHDAIEDEFEMVKHCMVHVNPR